jgi:hypothetical protein
METNVMNVPQDHLDRLVRLDLKVSQALKEMQDLRARQDQLENKALKDNLALSDLLVRLESVLVNAKQFWYHKTTLLRWMIIILALLVMDRLLLHSPEIVKIVMKLL